MEVLALNQTLVKCPVRAKPPPGVKLTWSLFVLLRWWLMPCRTCALFSVGKIQTRLVTKLSHYAHLKPAHLVQILSTHWIFVCNIPKHMITSLSAQWRTEVYVWLFVLIVLQSVALEQNCLYHKLFQILSGPYCKCIEDHWD